MEFQLLQCWATGCPQTFYTFTELSNHHLDAHEVPLNPRARPPWAPKVRLTRWQPQPLLRGTFALDIVSANGATPQEQRPAKEPMP